ncbi:MAG: hypothetical protein K2W96_04855 [Gemmataceae bacterium]|nr:hypothetical protein [Gemmataceae bacterium]
MSVAALLDRLDDWINPIVVKELRQAVKSRLVVVILMGFLTVQLCVMGWYLGTVGAQADAGTANWSAGAGVFNVLQWVLLPTLMVVIPAHAGIRFGNERLDSNVDLLFISTLKPTQIVWGKFFAAFMLSLMVLSMVAPFMVFAYLMRGIDLPTMAVVIGIDLLGMTGATMFFLFLGSIPGGRPVKVFFNIMGLIVLAYAFGGTGYFTYFLIHNEFGFFALDNWRFWVAAAAITALVLAETALLFFYAAAIISPPSSNRVMPIRLAVLGYWLLAGAALWLWSRSLRSTGMPDHFIPIVLWAGLGVNVLCRQLLVSVCERDEWGPRVARAIPRNPVLRFLAFFLYTGSAGGIAFTLLLMGATLGTTWLLLDDAGPFADRARDGVLAVAAGVCLYAVCYCLSAFVLRGYALREQIRPGYTWILAILLVGLGSAVPAIAFNVFFSDHVRGSADSGWWLLANPFITPYELAMERGYRQHDFALMAWWFLSTWAVLALVLSVPLLLGQAGRFRPYQGRAPAREG